MKSYVCAFTLLFSSAGLAQDPSSLSAEGAVGLFLNACLNEDYLFFTNNLQPMFSPSIALDGEDMKSMLSPDSLYGKAWSFEFGGSSFLGSTFVSSSTTGTLLGQCSLAFASPTRPEMVVEAFKTAFVDQSSLQDEIEAGMHSVAFRYKSTRAIWRVQLVAEVGVSGDLSLLTSMRVLAGAP